MNIEAQTHILDPPAQVLDVRHELHLLLRPYFQIQTPLMRRDDLQVWREREDIPQGPRLEEIERDVRMRLQQRAKRHQALFDSFQPIPLRVFFIVLSLRLGVHVLLRSAFSFFRFRLGGLGDAGAGPTLHERFHSLEALHDGICCAADDVVEEHLW